MSNNSYLQRRMAEKQRKFTALFNHVQGGDIVLRELPDTFILDVLRYKSTNSFRVAIGCEARRPDGLIQRRSSGVYYFTEAFLPQTSGAATATNQAGTDGSTERNSTELPVSPVKRFGQAEAIARTLLEELSLGQLGVLHQLQYRKVEVERREEFRLLNGIRLPVEEQRILFDTLVRVGLIKQVGVTQNGPLKKAWSVDVIVLNTVRQLIGPVPEAKADALSDCIAENERDIEHAMRKLRALEVRRVMLLKWSKEYIADEALQRLRELAAESGIGVHQLIKLVGKRVQS